MYFVSIEIKGPNDKQREDLRGKFMDALKEMRDDCSAKGEDFTVALAISTKDDET